MHARQYLVEHGIAADSLNDIDGNVGDCSSEDESVSMVCAFGKVDRENLLELHHRLGQSLMRTGDALPMLSFVYRLAVHVPL